MTTNSINFQNMEENKRHNEVEEGRKEREFDEQKKQNKAMRIQGYLNSAAKLGTAVGKLNHPSWYTKIKNLAQAAAKISTGYQVGDYLPAPFFTTTVEDTEISGALHQSAGAYMGFRFVPTYGGISEKDTVQRVWQATYAYIYANINRINNYDPSDLGKYIICVDSIVTLLAQYGKVVRAAKYQDPLNIDISKQIIYHAGFNASDIKKHINDYGAQINELILDFSNLNVPRNIDYFVRHEYLVSNIFKDKYGPKGQYYGFDLDGYYQWDSTKAQAVWKWLPNNNSSNGASTLTGDQMFSIIQDCISALKSDSDILKISGDISKAFNDGDLIKWQPFDSNLTLLVTVQDDFNNQVSNMTITGMKNYYGKPYPANMPSMDIQEVVTGSQSYLKFPTEFICDTTLHPFDIMTASIAGSKPFSKVFDSVGTNIIDFYKPNPTEDDVFMATRLSAVGRYKFQTTGGVDYITYEAQTLGSELISRATVYFNSATENYSNGIVSDLNFESAEFVNTILTCYATGIDAAVARGLFRLMRILPEVTSFDWHPRFYNYSLDLTESFLDSPRTAIIGELDNYSMVDARLLSNLHKASLYSLLLNPQSGSYFNN